MTRNKKIVFTLFSQITDTIMIFNLIFWYFHFARFAWDGSFWIELALSRMFNQIVQSDNRLTTMFSVFAFDSETPLKLDENK